MNIKLNLEALVAFLSSKQLGGILLNTQDAYLSEYVPLPNNLLYHFSGFSGSTAELLVEVNGTASLLVDGRYHEQAEGEVEATGICVIKYGDRQNITLARQEIFSRQEKWAILAERSTWHQYQEWSQSVRLFLLSEQALFPLFRYEFGRQQARPIYGISLEQTGECASNKWARLTSDIHTGIWASNLDVVAWLSNCRGQELPFQSTFEAKALCLSQQLHIFVPTESKIADSAQQLPGMVWHQVDMSQLGATLATLRSQLSLEKVLVAVKTISAADFQMLQGIFPQVVAADELVLAQQSSKNTQEMAVMAQDFEKSNQAIFQALQWVKEVVAQTPGKYSELDFFHQTNNFYQQAGAFQQSFATISAVGPHSSIIHFSRPSGEVKLLPGELVLLDSGGLYEAGYATDTTRTILSGGVAAAWQQEIYTLVLRALLHLQHAVFPVGTWGAHLDGIGRGILYRAGYNYQHGTGHGIGINVHEGGFSLGTRSQVPLRPNVVGTLEPGIYLPGQGGVRLENTVVVEPHPTFDQMLCFRPLTFVGFDFTLIQMEALELQERRWLMEYEEQCAQRGTSFYLLPQ